MTTTPTCQRPDHEDYEVVRDGIQHRDQRARQRWRCVAPDGTFHRFLGALSITRTDEGVCPTCERPYVPSEGPTSPARYEYLVREIAGALVAIGSGDTYTQVAEQLRIRAWGNRQWKRKNSTHPQGALVAEWLAQYGPVVAAPYAETEWPDTLVLDSTRFMHTDRETGVSSELFCVFFAYGYPSDGTKARMWKMAASVSDTGQDWADFLATLPGKPRVIVCDDDSNIKAGIRSHWYRGRGVLIHSCEYHLYQRAHKAMDSDKVPDDSPVRQALRVAFHSLKEWDVLRDAVRIEGAPTLKKWMSQKNTMVTRQLARRAEVSVYSNGAVEAPIRVIRRDLESRAWYFRNRARMDLLLEVMRLHLNQVATPETYAQAIREHLDAMGGAPTNQRHQWDPKGSPSLRR